MAGEGRGEESSLHRRPPPMRRFAGCRDAEDMKSACAATRRGWLLVRWEKEKREPRVTGNSTITLFFLQTLCMCEAWFCSGTTQSGATKNEERASTPPALLSPAVAVDTLFLQIRMCVYGASTGRRSLRHPSTSETSLRRSSLPLPPPFYIRMYACLLIVAWCDDFICGCMYASANFPAEIALAPDLFMQHYVVL